MEKTLSYRVVRPTTEPRPTESNEQRGRVRLLLLHGYGSNREDMLQLAPFFPECEVIAPHAPVDLIANNLAVEDAGVSGWFRPKAYCWYRFRFDPIPKWWEQLGETAVRDMADLLQPAEPEEFRQALALLQELAARLREEPGRLIVGGFSQGAAMACALGLLRPELVDGVVLWSGYFPPLKLIVSDPDLLPLPGWPVFISHGTGDPLIPFSHAAQMREYLTQRAARVTFQAEHCGHEITPGILHAVRDWLKSI
ncbi:MAG: alpha/beta fold hydrolase [Limnochordales bacterium]|nr:alpha/beta fold hydrolase [Limnochordales bacterium]